MIYAEPPKSILVNNDSFYLQFLPKTDIRTIKAFFNSPTSVREGCLAVKGIKVKDVNKGMIYCGYEPIYAYCMYIRQPFQLLYSLDVSSIDSPYPSIKYNRVNGATLTDLFTTPYRVSNNDTYLPALIESNINIPIIHNSPNN